MKTLTQILAEQRAAGVTAPRADDDSITLVERRIYTPALGVRGYLRLLPPNKPTVLSLDGDWIKANWDVPSAWCRFEGEAEHPGFAGNLKTFQGAQ